MSRLLVVSHTGRGTGFGKVAAEIATALGGAHEVHLVGLGGALPGETWCAHDHDPRFDPMRTAAAARLAADLRPSAAVLVGEARVLGWMAARMRGDGGYPGPILAYIPLEGEVADSGGLAGLRHITVPVAYTHTAAATLRSAWKNDDATEILRSLTVIPHGVDPPEPRPLGTLAQTRERLFPDHSGDFGACWLLNANRNDIRKRPELTLRAFARVAEQHLDATLVLHCAPRRRGLDLRIERDRLGLRGRVILTKELDDTPWPLAALNELYHCCEIGVNSASGEGWGLVAFEHAARGGAQILPQHPSLLEIWGSAPAWIGLGPEVRADSICVGREPDVNALALAMSDLIARPARRHEVAAACAARAADPLLRWSAVGERWLELVEALDSI